MVQQFARRIRKYSAALSLFSISLSIPLTAQKTEPLATIPFVSCPADGQLGPVRPKPHTPIRLSISPTAAAQLAYYHSAFDAGGLGVLAPRGWHCFGTYGSNGESLYVAPVPMTAKDFFGKSAWRGITGPGIQLSIEDGGTSGRFGVAQAIVDVFPHHMQFVTDLIANEKQFGGAPLDFKSQRGPSDAVQYKSNELVEFNTPPNTKGVGTSSWLQSNDLPIHGLMYLGGINNPDSDVFLVKLFVRFPAGDDDLRVVITNQLEAAARSLK